MHLIFKDVSLLSKSTALFSTSVGSSTSNVYHGDSLIFCNNYISLVLALSCILRVKVAADRKAYHIWFAAVSPIISRQISFAVRRINSFSIIKGFFALALRTATKYDAHNAAMFTDVTLLCCYNGRTISQRIGISMAVTSQIKLIPPSATALCKNKKICSTVT